LALYYNLLLNFALKIKYTQVILSSMLHFLREIINVSKSFKLKLQAEYHIYTIRSSCLRDIFH